MVDSPWLAAEPTKLLVHSPPYIPQQDGGIGRAKARKIMGHNKNSLISEGKKMSDAKAITHCF